MFVQSRDCASAICKHNGLTRWERPSWLTEESWELSEMVMSWTGALHRSGSLCAHTQTEGKGVSPSWWTSQKPMVRGLEYTCPTLKVKTELQELITYISYLYIRWKLEGFNCARNRNCAISRLRKPSAQSQYWHAISGFWECVAQSRDCANSQMARTDIFSKGG